MKYRLVTYEDGKYVNTIKSMFPFRITDICDALKTGVMNKSEDALEVSVFYYKEDEQVCSVTYDK